MGIPPFLKGQRCNGPSCSTWSRAFAVTSGFPTHCTTSISSSALYSFCVFRFLHCIRGFHCLDLDFVNTAYATEATKVHTVVTISSFAVNFR